MEGIIWTENKADITPAQLEKQYRIRHPYEHFFDDDTLRFFGERRSDYKIMEHTAIVDGEECYALSSLQRNHPMGAKRTLHYFTVENFDNVIAI